MTIEEFYQWAVSHGVQDFTLQTYDNGAVRDIDLAGWGIDEILHAVVI